MSKITWTLNLQIEEGPRFAIPADPNSQVEAYDRVDLQVPTDQWANVQVQPGNLSDIQLIFIRRTDTNTDLKVQYKVNQTGDPLDLTNVHVLLGEGAFGLLKAAPNSLQFKAAPVAGAKAAPAAGAKAAPAADAKTATVTVLIGRKATQAGGAAAPTTTATTAGGAAAPTTTATTTGGAANQPGGQTAPAPAHTP